MKNITISLFAIIALSLTGIKTFGQPLFYPQGSVLPTALSGVSVYSMTPVGGGGCDNQSGMLWSNLDLHWDQPFILTFQASFTNETIPAADGIEIVFGQNINYTTTTPLSYGGDLGYYDTLNLTLKNNSFGIELDIFDDGATYWHDIPGIYAGDTSIDHTTICEDAVPTPVTTNTVTAGPVPINGTAGIKDSIFHNYMVTWDPGTHLLKIYYECNLLISSDATTWNIPIGSLFTTTFPIKWGFTASTGGNCSSQLLTNINMTVPTTICEGSTTSLKYTPAGGTWSSSNTAVATVGTTGTVTGVSTGVAAITYTAPLGCVMVTSVTVTTTVPPITGPSFVCVDGTITLSDAITYGGVWSSSNTNVATAGPYSGIITGVSAGTATIIYSVGGCWPDTHSITVLPLPAPITGITSVCVGSTITLSDATPGGTWSSSSYTITTVGPTTGIVTGLIAGTDTIRYVDNSIGCAAIKTVTVNPVPTITGNLTICSGATSTLSSGSVSGTWSSSNTSVATVGVSSRIVYGISPGTSIITCTTSHGCVTTTTVTVVSTPPPITGPSSVCNGYTIELSDALAYGNWTSSNTAIATIGPGSNNILTGVSPGTVIITYTIVSGGCFSTTSVTITSPPASITGPTQVCDGSTVALTDATSGGIWSSSTPSLATINSSTGVVTGISTGFVTITYSVSGYNCPTMYGVYIRPTPSITGVNTVCDGGTITLSTSVVGTYGGVWSSSNTTVATVSASGVVSSVSTGTVTITYTTTYSLCSGSENITINPAPGPITGPSSVCLGSAIMLSDAVGGGTWTSSNTGVATIDPGTGMLISVNTGITTITYTLGGGCFTSTTVTVNALPGTITGTDSLCVGNTTILSDNVSPGIWSSSSSSVATIDPSTGIVTGVSAGTTFITYSLIDGCGASTATVTVKVDPLPDAITGNTLVCAGSITTLSDDITGGTWTSGNTTIAVIDGGSGIVTGIDAGTTAGTAIISYTLGTGCYAITSMTVNPTPAITGPVNVCANSEISLSSDIGSGVWSSSNTSIATVVSGTGVVSGVSTGTVTITYALGTGCEATATVIVNTAPAPISGSGPVCVGSTITFSDAVGGGIWTSSNTGVATIDPGLGIVTGVTAGTVTITYAIGSCIATQTVLVNPAPTITGASSLCAGSSIVLSTSITGGTWSSSNTDVATILAGTGGEHITGVQPGGVVTITYLLSTGCEAMKTVTVNPTPTISGPAAVCVGTTITLSDLAPGGTWVSGSPGIATVGLHTGVVGGVNAGGVIIYYISTAGCLATYSVAVMKLPIVDIDQKVSVYVGCSIMMEGHVSGSYTTLLWSSANTTIAVVSPATVLTTTLTGVSIGTTTITFSATNMCGTSSITSGVTVLPIPTVSISSSSPFCAGTSIALTATPTGGAWSSSNTSVATVGLGSGVVTGVDPGGTSVITYAFPLDPGCAATGTTTVTVNEAPTPITGNIVICSIGGTTILSEAITGGTWSSSNVSVATVVSGMYGDGVVTSAGSGTTVITYTLSDGCQTSATVTVLDSAPACVCSSYEPGEPFIELEAAHTGTLTTSPIAGTNYYLNHNITINGSISMLNCVIVMSPSVSITVNSGGKLTVTHSHLFCCYPNMWQGIILSNTIPGSGGGTGPTGQLILGNDTEGPTLIEDAIVAVYIYKPINMVGYNPATAGAGLLTLYCDGATFNKDSIGIGIETMPTAITPVAGAPVSEHPGYPFEIDNTVFTCRNFYGFSTAPGMATTWPFVWPKNNGTAAIQALKAPVTPVTPYDPPYYIGTSASAAVYTPTVCNNGVHSYCGIGLENVGATIGSLGTAVYSSVVVGSSYPLAAGNPDLNLYDNMAFGILAVNSNVVSRNSVYMNMNDFTALGASRAIYSFRNASAAAVGNLYKLDVYGNATGYNNKFWNCITDVRAQDLYYVRGIYSQMSSEHTSSAPTSLLGQYGYDVTVSQYYNVELTHNTIYNLYTGISSYLMPPGIDEALVVGQMTVDSNTIKASSTGAPTALKEYVHTAIDVEALVYPSYGTYYVVGSEINTDYNTIEYPYNGIMLIGFDLDFQPKTSISNTVTVTPDITASVTATTYEQAGILHDEDERDWIEDNYIVGPGYNVPLPPIAVYSVTPTYTIIEGIHCGNENDLTICGNLTKSTNTGVFFYGNESVTWANNTMENNAFGYVLSSGTIGAQPPPAASWGVPGWNAFYTGNQWLGTWGPVAGGGTKWQTYTIGDPDLTLNSYVGSPMLVKGVPTQNPTNNGQDPGVADAYNVAPIITGGITIVGTDPWSCGAPPPTSVPAAYLRVSKKQTGYVMSASQKDWISQMMMYRHIANDTTVDTNAVLHSFKLMAVNSRYKNLMDIEQDIATGNYSAANTLLGYPYSYMASADSSSTTGAVLADSNGYAVVANYRAYYQLLVKYMIDTLSSSDSAQIQAMANLCPCVNGPVIYKVRALYNAVFNDSRLFNDLGCTSSGGGDYRTAHTGDSTSGSGSTSSTMATAGLENQQYSLHPNPSDGNVTLEQKVPDNNPVMAEVWNEAGEIIYKGQLNFTGGFTNLKVINAIPGIYLLQLIDSGGNRFMIKFVISEK